jgi:hypothetical protein
VARSIRDPRITVHDFNVHAGLANNWNRLLRLARGEYVSIVGQDDEVGPQWASSLVGLLEVHPKADLAFGRRAFVFDDERSRSLLGDFFERRYPAMLEQFYRRVGMVIQPEAMLSEVYRYRFEINLIGEPTFVVMRRNSPALTAGFDPLMSQMVDWELFTRFFVDRPIVHCPEILGAYHIHAKASSIANVHLSRHYREYEHLLGIVLERFAGVLGIWRSTVLKIKHSKVRSLYRNWNDGNDE